LITLGSGVKRTVIQRKQPQRTKTPNFPCPASLLKLVPLQMLGRKGEKQTNDPGPETGIALFFSTEKPTTVSRLRSKCKLF
jgi:hypothetical protein